MIQQGWSRQRREANTQSPESGAARSSRWRELKHEAAPKRGPSFLDRMLGKGADKTLRKAWGESRDPSPASGSSRATLKIETVGGLAQRSAGRPGLLRTVAVVLIAGWLGLRITYAWLDRTQAGEKSVPAAQPLADPKLAKESGWMSRFFGDDETPEQRFKRLPVLQASGKAVGYTQDSLGRWYAVNDEGELREADLAEFRKQLALPQLRGIFAWAERRSGKVKRLQISEGLLEELLPLPHDLASNVEWIWVDDKTGASLRTYGGTRLDLGREDLHDKALRAAVVLADLGARRRHAVSVDMRQAGAAVVRLAGR